MRARPPEQPSDFISSIPTIRQIQIKAARLVSAVFAGEYSSAFRGRGIEFDEVREYQPGDDVRSIDWNVTARQGHPFVKRFIEERELTLVILLDRSPSMRFGTVRSTKIQAATEATALLAFAALRSHDRISLITFGDGGLYMLPPGKGKRHALRLVRDAATPSQVPGETAGLAAALDYLDHAISGKAVVCVFSDFHGDLPVRSLSTIAARHDTVAISVTDPLEHELPSTGLLMLNDPETEDTCMIDAGSPYVRRHYRLIRKEHHEGRRKELLRAGTDFMALGTQTPPLHHLIRFFQHRTRKRP